MFSDYDLLGAHHARRDAHLAVESSCISVDRTLKAESAKSASRPAVQYFGYKFEEWPRSGGV